MTSRDSSRRWRSFGSAKRLGRESGWGLSDPELQVSGTRPVYPFFLRKAVLGFAQRQVQALAGWPLQSQGISQRFSELARAHSRIRMTRHASLAETGGGAWPLSAS